MAYRHLADVELAGSTTPSTSASQPEPFVTAAETWRAPSPAEFHTHAHVEFDSLCSAIARRLRNNTLPPDEAYWWTRILVSEAAVHLHKGCVLDWRPASSAADPHLSDEQPGQAAA
jgi:hypothetical protein